MARREEARTVPVTKKHAVVTCDYCHVELSTGSEDWYDMCKAAGWHALAFGSWGRQASHSLDVCPKCAVGVGEMMAKKSAASGGNRG